MHRHTYTAEDLCADFTPPAEQWQMNWQLEPHGRRRRVLVMVSKMGQCLGGAAVGRFALSLRVIDRSPATGNHEL